MADKKRAKPRKSSMYEIKDGKLVRKNKYCPRCGPGVFMAQHKKGPRPRISCGRCGYTEFMKK